MCSESDLQNTRKFFKRKFSQEVSDSYKSNVGYLHFHTAVTSSNHKIHSGHVCV